MENLNPPELATSSSPPADAIQEAAQIIADAEALLINAGAGMGVDSGLPDFRGPEGFWKAYPVYRHLGFNFAAIANPRHFAQDPPLAWGFYGHRLNLYRVTQPHAGFAILKRWGERMRGGHWVFTSNVDGQFQRAGFDGSRITEVHGSIHHLQCLRECGIGIFAADGVQAQVDETTMRCQGELPRCPSCGGLARPNILMFGDGSWDSQRSDEQERGFERWLAQTQSAKQRLAIVELGAGTGIPTVRYCSENVAEEFGGRLVRINLREFDVPPGQVGLPMRALEGLQALDSLLTS